jgi:hypothetical protein
MFEKKSSTDRGAPLSSCNPQLSASGITVTPGDRRPEDEDGSRDTKVGEDHRADVHRRVAAGGGQQAERHADDRREEQGDDRQLDGDGQSLQQDVRDGSAESDGTAQVTLE